MKPLRVLFALPGFHRVNRGAEVALEAVARELAWRKDFVVTLIGSGSARPEDPYCFIHAGCVGREQFEHFPRLPPFRNEFAYEEFTFVSGLIGAYRASEFDLTLTCSFPFVHWVLRAKPLWGRAPAHVFVTQNGDWPAYGDRSEYRFFRADGLVCTNLDYYERNRDRWFSTLIPNGVDTGLFSPGPGPRAAFGLPPEARVVLMVSALESGKRVLDAIRCIPDRENVHLVVAGDGPLRNEVERLGSTALGQRFHRRVVAREKMPDLYRCADVFLHMNQSEPFGLAYVEALASGLTIVTHDSSATRDTLGSHALLVDTTDANAVTAALERALSEKSVELIAARRRFAEERYTWNSIGTRYATFLREVHVTASRRSAL